MVNRRPPSPDPDLFAFAERRPWAEKPRVPRPSLNPLPLDSLLASLKQLSDADLKALNRAVEEEMRLRHPATTATVSATVTKPARGKADADPWDGLTAGQRSLIDAALKAGVDLASVARQVGLTTARMKKIAATLRRR